MKVLVIRLSSIGDIVLTTPVLRLLKLECNAEVHFVTKKGNLKWFENPHVDHFYAYEEVDKGELSAHDFDHVIDLHSNTRSKAFHSFGKQHHVLNKKNIAKWAMVNFKLNPHIDHIVTRYLNTFPLIQDDGKGLDFFIKTGTKLPIAIMHSNYAVYAIGGQHQTKKLPLDQMIRLVDEIKTPLVLIGGPEDEDTGMQIEKNSDGGTLYNLTGKLSIAQSARVMKDATVVITHDTGMMHIAAALDKVIYSIWGNTIPEIGMTPWFKKGSINASKSLIFRNKVACQPCSKIGHNGCPLGHFNCMTQQDTSEIARQINELILKHKE